MSRSRLQVTITGDARRLRLDVLRAQLKTQRFFHPWRFDRELRMWWAIRKLRQDIEANP